VDVLERGGEVGAEFNMVTSNYIMRLHWSFFQAQLVHFFSQLIENSYNSM
jgi:hypothetical protein